MTSPSPLLTRPATRRHRLPALLPADQTLRVLAAVTLINTLGNGLFYTTGALFFTRSLGLTPSQVGVGLAVAGMCGIVAGPPLGALADRWGVKRTLLVLFAADGIGSFGYLVIHGFPAFLVLASVIAFVDRGASAVRNALVGDALPAERRVHGRAYLRAVANVGMGTGAALAAAALQSDTRTAYLAVVAADAVTFLLAGAVLFRLRPVARPAPAGGAGQNAITRPPSRTMRAALTDVRYLLITGLNGVLALQFGVMQIGLPLWVVRSTHAPRWVIAAVFVTNTAMVVALQVRFSRGTESPPRAARACGRAGLLIAAACAVYGLAHGLPAAAAAAMLIGGGVVQTIGEMLSSAGGWALSYDLADPSAHGAYQGIFSSGFNAGNALSALVVTSTAIRFGLPGWLLLGAVFAAAGAALVPATRWAQARLAARPAGAGESA